MGRSDAELDEHFDGLLQDWDISQLLEMSDLTEAQVLTFLYLEGWLDLPAALLPPEYTNVDFEQDN